jgi:hypothetical protein
MEDWGYYALDRPVGGLWADLDTGEEKKDLLHLSGVKSRMLGQLYSHCTKWEFEDFPWRVSSSSGDQQFVGFAGQLHLCDCPGQAAISSVLSQLRWLVLRSHSDRTVKTAADIVAQFSVRRCVYVDSESMRMKSTLASKHLASDAVPNAAL